MFLVQKFNQGVAGGQKADPVHVAREMSIRTAVESYNSTQTNGEPLNKLVPFSQGRQRCSAKDKLMK